MPKSQNNKFRKKKNRTFKKKRMKGGNKKSKEAGTPKTKQCPKMLAKSCLKGTLKDPMCKSDACVKQMKQLPEYKEKMGNRPSTLPPSVPKNKKLETKISESKNKKMETKISESKNKKLETKISESKNKKMETKISESKNKKMECSKLSVKSGECKTTPGCRPQTKDEFKKYKKEKGLNPKSKNKKCIKDIATPVVPEPVVTQPETAIVAQPEPVVTQPETAIKKLYDEKKTKNACIEVDLHANKTYYVSKDQNGKTSILDAATNEPPPGQTVNDAVKGGDVDIVYYYNPKTRETTYDPDDPICQTENQTSVSEEKCKADFCPPGHEGSWTRKCYTGSVRKHHPDKGGDPETFKRLKHCHDKLSKAANEVKKAEEDVKVANETLNDAFEEKKQTELKLEDAKQQEQEAKQEILQLEDESKPEPVVEQKSCETKKDCGTDFCLTPIDGGEGKCVHKDEYVSNMKSRKQPKESQEESNLEGVGQMFNEPEHAVVTPEPADVTPEPADVTPEPADVTPEPAVVTTEPSAQEENVDQLKKQIEELKKKLADGCPKSKIIERTTEDYWNEIYGISNSNAELSTQTTVQDGAAKRKASKKSRRKNNTRKRRRKNKTKKR